MSSNATAGARGGVGGGNSNGGNFLSVPPTPGVVYAPADPGINDNWEMGKLNKFSSINYLSHIWQRCGREQLHIYSSSNNYRYFDYASRYGI